MNKEKVFNKNVTYYCIVDVYDSFIETYMDIDTNEVINMPRTVIIGQLITKLVLPFCYGSTNKFNFIDAYLKGNSKHYKLQKILDKNKFEKIEQGLIKKYRNIPIEHIQS